MTLNLDFIWLVRISNRSFYTFTIRTMPCMPYFRCHLIKNQLFAIKVRIAHAPHHRIIAAQQAGSQTVPFCKLRPELVFVGTKRLNISPIFYNPPTLTCRATGFISALHCFLFIPPRCHQPQGENNMDLRHSCTETRSRDSMAVDGCCYCALQPKGHPLPNIS